MSEHLKAVHRAMIAGYMVDSKAFDIITKLPPEFDVIDLIDRVLKSKSSAQSQTRVITEEDVRRSLPAESSEGVNVGPLEFGERQDVEVVFDPTPALSPTEANEGYNKLFRDRYERLLALTRSRPDMKGLVSTIAARNLSQGQKAKVPGLLSNKGNRRGGLELTIDDPHGVLNVVCQGEVVEKEALEAPLDCLVTVEVSKGKNGRLYANSLFYPDIADKRPVTSSHEMYAVLLSDLHIGSKMFLMGDFDRFISWLNGKLGDENIVNKIRYLVIAGDLVDGVGVYPGQELQLGDKDPKHQYYVASQLLEQVPKHIQIVISPGNHDATRQALPQPAVSVDLADSLYGLENVRWIGNPGYIKMGGVTFLVYHGKSLDDVIATTPSLSYQKPADAMKLLLKTRHLAPTYGKRTALAPELRDFLVIDQVPEVFHCGHVHTFDVSSYRGTLLVNSGTFQAQTNFQSNMGLEPTPSIVPIVNLSNLSVSRRNFGVAGFVTV